MDKEQRDAEINRIVDIATAAENARLMGGGIGPGDVIDLREDEYPPPQAPLYSRSEIPDSKTGDGEDRDECGNCGRTRSSRLPADVVTRINDIKALARAEGYADHARADVPYLLEVIDALESGRL